MEFNYICTGLEKDDTSGSNPIVVSRINFPLRNTHCKQNSLVDQFP